MLRRITTTMAVLALASVGMPAQEVVNRWEETRGGVVTALDENTLTGKEYAADGIIDDWASLLSEFKESEASGELEDIPGIKGMTAESVTVRGHNGVEYSLPRILDESGADLFMLTDDGIAIYMALDAPAYLQDVDGEVTRWVRFYAVKKRAWTERVFRRYERWEPFVKEALRREGVPEELGELCLIESGCTADALSKAGALGMWQIMPATGRSYGMTIDALTDERTDQTRSTLVAARILRDNHKATGDWTLAAAAYNCGAGRIGRARGGRPVTDWESAKGRLPEETRNYIPGLLAIHYLWTYRKELGLNR